MNSFAILVAAPLLFSAAQRPSLAGSATWNSNPTSGDWNTAANWTPQTVPNATSDVATFGASNVTNLLISFGSTINLDSAVFNSGASPYTVTLDVSGLILNGAGIVNNSGLVQSVIIPEEDQLGGGMFLYNSATAGNMTSFSTIGGFISFNDTSSAGSATFALAGGSLQASMNFFDGSTAANATINASTVAITSFFDAASGANATFNLTTGAFLVFNGNTNADHVIGTCIGGIQSVSSEIVFQGFASAGQGIFTAVGASTTSEKGSFIELLGSATADHATFVINGGMGAGFEGTSLIFVDTTTAANANITANGGLDGSDGGVISFQEQSKGGKASISLSGNAELDISAHNAPGVTIGSLAGTGSVLLGANTLTVGSNNQSTIFSGVAQGAGGLTKTGSGTVTLTGSNAYTGNTTVTAGVLAIRNRRGSGAGTGSVNVQAGTLAGKGIISGAVTIGTGSGSGAFLTPSFAAKQPATLTCKSTLSLNSDSTYTCQLNTKKDKADEVSAKGVTIDAGAQFSLQAVANKKLTVGTHFTVIANTSIGPISGTFANLADNSTIVVGRNSFQVTYEGGDGNDLVLTVVH